MPNYPVFSLCAVKMEVVTAAIVASARFILLTRFASLLFKQRTKDEPTYQCCSHHLYSIFISAAHTALSFIKKAKRIYLHSEIWHFYALVCCILQNGNNILPNAFPRPSFVARPRGMNKISYMKYEFIRREIFVCVWALWCSLCIRHVGRNLCRHSLTYNHINIHKHTSVTSKHTLTSVRTRIFA